MNIRLRIECFLFDLDGTIIDTSELIFVSVRNVVRETVGITIKKIDYNNWAAINPHSVLKSYGIQHGMNQYWKHYLSNIGHAKLFFDTTFEVLDSLKRKGKLLGIVSSLPKSKIDKLLEQFELIGNFETIVGWERRLPKKPDPASLLTALKNLSISPENAAYVGDRNIDMQAAYRAGLMQIFVSWSSTKLKNENKPDVIINSFKDLLIIDGQ